MNLPHIDILVEEPSMEAALDHLAPRIIGGRAAWKIINFWKQVETVDKAACASSWLQKPCAVG